MGTAGGWAVYVEYAGAGTLYVSGCSGAKYAELGGEYKCGECFIVQLGVSAPDGKGLNSE